MKRIAIVGARRTTGHQDEYDAIVFDVDSFMSTLGLDRTLVSGGASGVDSYAERYADMNGIEKAIFYPDYATHGDKAPLVRNQLIVDNSDEIHAWPSSWSRGTWYTVRRAR